MRKLTIKCDCCQSEIEEKDVFPLDIYVHVFPHFNRLAGHVKVINGRPYSTSGRTERKEFCLPCYNYLMEKFFCEVKEYGEIMNNPEPQNPTPSHSTIPPPIAGDKVSFKGVECLVTRPIKMPKTHPYNITVRPIRTIDDIGEGCGMEIEIPSDHPEIVSTGIKMYVEGSVVGYKPYKADKLKKV